MRILSLLSRFHVGTGGKKERESNLWCYDRGKVPSPLLDTWKSCFAGKRAELPKRREAAGYIVATVPVKYDEL